MGLNWFPQSICVSEASPTACDFHSRPTGFPKRSFQNQFQTECTVCLAGLPCSHPPCSEGLGGPLNSKPHNISKVNWWMLRKGISGQNLLDPIRNQKPSFTSGKRVREKDKLRAPDSEVKVERSKLKISINMVF